MNWKLIVGLSLFGLAMGFVTISWDAPKLEVFIWLLIFLFCAYLIARNAGYRFFLHGFLTGLASYVWVTIVHIKFSDEYLVHHPEQVSLFAQMSEKGHSISQSMLVMGAFYGIFAGIFLGLFALFASKLIATAYNN